MPGWGWTRSIDEFVAYWLEVHSVVNAPLVERLQAYRRAGVRCFLATVQERYRTDSLWRLLGVGQQFDGGFVSCQIGHRKNSAGFFEHILGQIPGVQPDEVLYLDDILRPMIEEGEHRPQRREQPIQVELEPGVRAREIVGRRVDIRHDAPIPVAVVVIVLITPRPAPSAKVKSTACLTPSGATSSVVRSPSRLGSGVETATPRLRRCSSTSSS